MKSSQFDIKHYRKTLGSFLTGVTVVTTINEHAEPIGFTANSFTSVSLEPPLVLACIAKSSFLSSAFSNAKTFAINILEDSQKDISNLFASRERDRFSQIEWRKERTGSPIIEKVNAWLDCETHQLIDAGDHFILLGKVISFDSNAGVPLGYLQGHYVQLALEQEAAAILENQQQNVYVGAIIEQNDKVFLIHDDDNNVNLPHIERQVGDESSGSLSKLIESLGLTIEASYLYSIFENKGPKSSMIFYRAVATENVHTKQGQFYTFDKIPLNQCKDKAIKSMLQRYISERAQDTFGIYFGDDQQGLVEPLFNETGSSQIKTAKTNKEAL